MIKHEQLLSRLAAVFAVSNFGMINYINDPVGTPSDWDDTPESEIEGIAGGLMESDEHEELFRGEARMWYNTLKNLSIGEIAEQYHYNSWVADIIKAYESTIPLQFRLLSDAAVAGRKDVGPLSD